LVGSFVLGMPSICTNNFPESGRGLGHVTAIIIGSMVGYPSDSLASCNLVLTFIKLTTITKKAFHTSTGFQLAP